MYMKALISNDDGITVYPANGEKLVPTFSGKTLDHAAIDYFVENVLSPFSNQHGFLWGNPPFFQYQPSDVFHRLTVLLLGEVHSVFFRREIHKGASPAQSVLILGADLLDNGKAQGKSERGYKNQGRGC